MMTNYHSVLDKTLPTAGNFRACFGFSIHKAGSSMMFDGLTNICRYANVPSFSMAEILFSAGVMDLEWEADSDLARYFSAGRVYIGFRYFPSLFKQHMEIFAQAKSVLLVRDPRDALVSQYFSWSGSHRLPERNQGVYLSQFEATAQTAIDKYVLAAAPEYRRKLEEYRPLLDSGNVKLYRYEDVIFKKEEFLTDVMEHYGIPVSPDIVARVAKGTDVRPLQEDATKHIRKVTPGDHKNKLGAEAILSLNDVFRESGALYGYKL